MRWTGLGNVGGHARAECAVSDPKQDTRDEQHRDMLCCAQKDCTDQDEGCACRLVAEAVLLTERLIDSLIRMPHTLPRLSDFASATVMHHLP